MMTPEGDESGILQPEYKIVEPVAAPHQHLIILAWWRPTTEQQHPMTQIVVKTYPEPSAASGQVVPEDVARVAERFAVILAPMHPGTRDATLSTYYTADVADPAAAEELAKELRGKQSVDAAYVKPAGEPPQTMGD